MLSGLLFSVVCLVAPVNGPVAEGYSPVGEYGGHWGIDYAVPVGTPVRAPVSGRVGFAGTVAGMRSVTVEPVPGLKVSVSYLAAISVRSGESVAAGEVVGVSGPAHGRPAVHLSTRIDGRYVNPSGQLGCRATDVTRALRLVTPPGPYARRRAHRDTGRDLRPDPYRPSPRRGDGAAPSGARPAVVHPRR